MKTLKLIFCLMAMASMSFSQVQKIGDDLFLSTSPDEQHNCTEEIKFDPNIHINSPMTMGNDYPDFIWPFSEVLDDGIVLVNYVDDQSGGTIKDYMGNSWAYNGHNGTDISLHNFRAMDRFYGVKAAAAGTVEQIAYSNYDRDTACITNANIVLIRHDDGSYAYYYHLMKNSVTVRVGEYVPVGRVIGYVGSSGCSSDAHLHFEPGRFISGTWNKRDPWHGTFNTLPSLWQSQYGYVRNRDIKVHNMGIFTAGLVGGNINNVGGALFKQGILQPYTVSGYEQQIGIHILMQGRNSGNQCKIEIRKPNGALYSNTSFYINDYWQYAWVWWTPNFNVGVAETGIWYARILHNNVEQMRVNFNVQLLTSNRPRLYPVAGKCFRRSVFVQRDTLRVRPVRENMEYELLNAPSNVTLTNDSILNISPSFNQFLRVHQFMVIASMGGSATLRDTLIYKLIDTTENHFTGNGIVSLETTGMMEGFWDGSDFNADTITVFLRSPLTPYNIVDLDEFKLNFNGFGIANFLYANGGLYYYIVVKHRNSIETWSNGTEELMLGQPNTYNFTTFITQAYGNNLRFKSGKWCFYGGDVNQDAFVDAADVVEVYNDVVGFTFGYHNTDVTGNNYVDTEDLILTYNNSRNFIGRIRP